MSPAAFGALCALLFASACGAPEGAAQSPDKDAADWRDALPRPQWAAYERVLADEPWFDVYRIFPDVYAIYEPGQYEEVISYLIIGEDRALLFDTGLGVAAIRPVAQALTALDIVVVNSHNHYDHIGGNHEFDDLRGVDHPYTVGWRRNAPETRFGPALEPEWLSKPLPEGMTAETFMRRPFAITGVIADGDVIDLGGMTLEVVAAPGHSPDSICLLDRGGRRLFVGDVFYPGALYAHIEGSDLAAYRDSAAKLAALQPGVDVVLTAHNTPVSDSAVLNRMKEAFDAIAAGTAAYAEADGAREYVFDGFSILTPSP